MTAEQIRSKIRAIVREHYDGIGIACEDDVVIAWSRSISEAIAGERERCAKLAEEEECRLVTPPGRLPEAIREGRQPTKADQ